MKKKNKPGSPKIVEKIDADELANSLSFVPAPPTPNSQAKKLQKPKKLEIDSIPDRASPRPQKQPKKKPKNAAQSTVADFDSDDLPTPVSQPNLPEPAVPEPRSPKAKRWTWSEVFWVFLALLGSTAVVWLKAQEEAWTATAGVTRESENFYETLHLEKTASAQEIKKAYKKFAVLLHPDKNADCSECSEKFAKVAKAYETLGNSEKRKIYDETRGAFETLPSDYSLELTSTNFHELVNLSPDLWLVQVFSDVDGSSRQFAPFWEAVAMEFHGKIKFGRINVRTHKDAVSLLPIRARNFPTVVLLSKTEYPAIFPLNDLSREAFRLWIAQELPDVFASNGAKPVVVLETKKNPSLDTKLAALNWRSVFQFEPKEAESGGRSREVFKLAETEISGEAGKLSENTLTGFARRFSTQISRENAERLCRGAFCVGSSTRLSPQFPKSNVQAVEVAGGNFVYDFDDELIVRGLKDASVAEILTAENPEELIEDLLFQPFSRKDFRAMLESEISEEFRWKKYFAALVSLLAGIFAVFKLSLHLDLKPLLFVMLGGSLVVSVAPVALKLLN